MWKRPPLQREGGLCPLNGPSSQLQWHPYPRSSILKRTFPVSLKSRQIGSLQGQPGEATGKLLTPDCTQKTESGKTEREMADLDSPGQPGFPTHIHAPSAYPLLLGFFLKHFYSKHYSRTEDQTKAVKVHDRNSLVLVAGHFRMISKMGELTADP